MSKVGPDNSRVPCRLVRESTAADRPRRGWRAGLLAAAVFICGCSGSFHAGDTHRQAVPGGPIEWPARDIEAAEAASAGRVVPVGMGVVRAEKRSSGPWTDPRTGESYRFVTYCDRAELRMCRPEEDGEPPGEGSRIAVSLPASGAPRAILLFLPGMTGARPKALMEWASGHGLAFLEIKPSAMDTPRPPVRIASASDLPAAAAELAADVDQRLAEVAYAAEGALAFFESEHAELRGLPVVLVGASAGALASPAVAARFNGRVAAAVLIGGGCDICQISLRSSMARKLLPIEWGPQTSYLDEARLSPLYRERTKLDPLVLAPRMGGIPVLNMYATVDSLVPTWASEELQQRLGGPDRVTYTGGHMMMFVSLRENSSVLARWIEEHLPAPKAPIRP